MRRVQGARSIGSAIHTLAATLFFAVLAARALAQPLGPVAYHLTYASSPDAHVSVEIVLAVPLTAPSAFVMPRAIPMGYGEQRYDRFVSAVRVRVGTTEVDAAREEGPRWRIPAGAGAVSYRIDVRAMEQDIHAASDASRLRAGYLSLLGYSVFGYIDGHEAAPITLTLSAPAQWPVFSTLAPRAPAAAGVMTAPAADFYALADSQIVMGPRLRLRLLPGTPVPVYLALYAEGEVDADRLAVSAATAFNRVAAYFGSIPFEHYTLLQELLQPVSASHEYGMSMEHLDSSTYYLAASTGLTAASPASEDARVLYNFAHHIAHAWVPKRAYGEGYFPFSWELAPVLDSIWFAEGFGQYAAIVAVADREADPAAFRRGMIERRFQANVDSAPPFLRRLPLVSLSRVASTRYAEDFRTGRLVFSRGGLMAADMDDRIRRQTAGTRSLRDALRFLVVWTSRERRAFRLDELSGLIEQATGVRTQAVIDEWLRPLP